MENENIEFTEVEKPTEESYQKKKVDSDKKIDDPQRIRQLKIMTLFTLLLSIAFYIFFYISKHDSTFSDVNAFANDPYDAVGSCGIQVAIGAALISILRFFCPGKTFGQSRSRQFLCIRAIFVSLLAIIVTLSVDVIALLRHTSQWIDSGEGFLLAVLVDVFLLVAILLLHRVYRLISIIITFQNFQPMRIMSAISLAGILIFSFYPETLREGFIGAVFTASVGICFLLIIVAVLTKIILSTGNFEYDDIFDDVIAYYHWLRRQFGDQNPLLVLVKMTGDFPSIKRFMEWLNPRKYFWRFVGITALASWFVLILFTIIGSDNLGGDILDVCVSVFLEVLGVIIAYMFLGGFLGIFRAETKA